MKNEKFRNHKISFTFIEERYRVSNYDILVTIYRKNSLTRLYRFYAETKKNGFKRAKNIIKIYEQTGMTPDKIKQQNRMQDSISGEYNKENW